MLALCQDGADAESRSLILVAKTKQAEQLEHWHKSRGRGLGKLEASNFRLQALGDAQEAQEAVQSSDLDHASATDCHSLQ